MRKVVGRHHEHGAFSHPSGGGTRRRSGFGRLDGTELKLRKQEGLLLDCPCCGARMSKAERIQGFCMECEAAA